MTERLCLCFIFFDKNYLFEQKYKKYQFQHQNQSKFQLFRNILRISLPLKKKSYNDYVTFTYRSFTLCLY